MKTLLSALAVGTLALTTTSLRADLLGTSVNGTLTFGSMTPNYFDPANGFVPSGYGNSTSPNNVIIGPGVEFGFSDSVNRDTANFTGNGLTVRDNCLSSNNCSGNNPFMMTFTDPAFASVMLLTNNLGVTYSLVGDVLTISDNNTSVPGGNATATFSIGTTAPTPEPGTMGLVATGLLGAAGALRKRFLA